MRLTAEDAASGMGRWNYQAKLGEGGLGQGLCASQGCEALSQGIVYRAYDCKGSLGHVAIKVLKHPQRVRPLSVTRLRLRLIGGNSTASPCIGSVSGRIPKRCRNTLDISRPCTTPSQRYRSSKDSENGTGLLMSRRRRWYGGER